MIATIIGLPCKHTQDVIINCFAKSEIDPYYEETRQIGQCRFCKAPLNNLYPYLYAGGETDEEKFQEAMAFPFVIDLSRVIIDNNKNAKLHTKTKLAILNLTNIDIDSYNSNQLSDLYQAVVESFNNLFIADPTNLVTMNYFSSYLLELCIPHLEKGKLDFVKKLLNISMLNSAKVANIDINNVDARKNILLLEKILDV